MKKIKMVLKPKLIISIAFIVVIIITILVTYMLYNNQQLKSMKKVSEKYFTSRKLRKEIGSKKITSKFNLGKSYYIKYPSFKCDNINNIIDNSVYDIIKDVKNKSISTVFNEITHHKYVYNAVDYESNLGVDGILNTTFIKTKINNKSKVISEDVYTFNLSINENETLKDTYIFVGDYKSVFRDYIINYLKANDKLSKKLKKNYDKVIDDKYNYKYAVTLDGIDVYFNSNEILKSNKVLKISIPYDDLSSVLNIDVNNKIKFKDLKKIKENYKDNKTDMYIKKLSNFYNKGSKNSKVISTIDKGNKVSVLKSSDTFSKIKYDDKVGYVLNSSLSSDIIAPKGYTDTNETVYAVDLIVVRKSVDDSSEELVSLALGDSILRIGTSDEGFSCVVYNGEKGFVKSSYLSLTKPSISTNFNIDKNRNVNSHGGMVALTFDDGPNPSSTGRILNTLEKYHAVATFFDLGKLVSAYPDVVKREEAIGCEVGSHTYSHANLNNLSAEGVQAEVNNSRNAFISVLGHDVRLLRPPYGNVNELVKANISYPIINWNVDTLDWKSRNKDAILYEVRKIGNLDGKIILMHSIYESTADAIEILVPELINEGYQLVTVSEMAYYKGVTLNSGEKYYGF